MASRSAGPPRGLGPGEVAEHGGHGGLFATILSAVALSFSGFSYYETSLKSADLSVYVPPMIHYARDGGDVFNVPITIANDGARTGTILSMVLEVENLRQDAARKTARFHSAFMGDYPRNDTTPNRSFAPLSIPGHGTFTETVRFYPMDDQLPFVVDDKGDYRFKLTLATATPENPDLLDKALRTDPKPLTFDLNLPYLAVQHLSFRNGTIAMFNKDWKPAVSSSTDPAVSRAAPKPSPSPSQPAPEPAPAAPEPGTSAQQPQSQLIWLLESLFCGVSTRIAVHNGPQSEQRMNSLFRVHSRLWV